MTSTPELERRRRAQPELFVLKSHESGKSAVWKSLRACNAITTFCRQGRGARSLAAQLCVNAADNGLSVFGAMQIAQWRK